MAPINIKFHQAKYFRAILIFIFFFLSAIIWFGFHLYATFYLSTDDAYINANVIQIAPRITGRVNTLNVAPNQHIKAGNILFTIDAAPFNYAAQEASANVKVQEAQVAKNKLIASRTLTLVKDSYASQQDKDNVTANLEAAVANLAAAQANLDKANLNLIYTQVSAPDSGWITNLSLRVGDIVAANEPLFALISDQQFWVDANFKEGDVSSIKPGMKAWVSTDLYPDHVFDARVESISGGAGAAFSLLPPQNATGNWVKITQRIPVRISILHPDPAFPLRIGISATVTIKLK